MKNQREAPGFMLYADYAPGIDRLDDAEAGRLLKALLRIAAGEETPALAGMEGLVLAMMLPRIEADRKKYREICERNAAKARTRWEKDAAACSGMQGDAADANLTVTESKHNHNRSRNRNHNQTEGLCTGPTREDVERMKALYERLKNS